MRAGGRWSLTLLSVALCLLTRPAAAQWAFNGPHIHNTNSGYIGMFITTPLNPLHIRLGINANLGMRATASGEVSIGAFNDAGSMSVPLSFDASLFTLTGGNVGIGTAAPAYPLHVAMAGGKSLVVRYDGTMASLAALAGGGPSTIRFDLDETFSRKVVWLPPIVGIGVANPQYALEVSSSSTRAISAAIDSVRNDSCPTPTCTAVHGASAAGAGVFATSLSQRTIYGEAPTNLNGHAALFDGDLAVIGMIEKPAGSFRIDHPLDPANKYLSHSFVESPDMKNIYNGVATLDHTGQATIELPEWFEALNRDFRYQLTAIGAPAPLYVAAEIAGGRFSIAGGPPGQRLSWQVTGIRKDAWAEKHRIRVEEDKTGEERGLYLHPAEHGQPDALRIGPKVRGEQ